MKRTGSLLLILLCIFTNVEAQNALNTPMKFVYQGKDTVLSHSTIAVLANTGQFPAYLKWKNTPFALKVTSSGSIGLFTDSVATFSSGQNVELAYIRVQHSGSFLNDYIESNLGMYVSNSQANNVSIVSTAQGLMMKAVSAIGPNTQIISSYQDILDLFPSDNTVRFKVMPKQ